MRKMQAKFPGVCKACGERIEVRQWILWEKGGKVIHVGCEPTKEREKKAEVDHGKTGYGLG